MHIRHLNSIHEVDAQCWDELFPGHTPFARHAFLAALEDSECADTGSGWDPAHVLIENGGEVLAAMPLYRKIHSYGEFVFDWGWAEAYQRHGLQYYPKLLTAIPFTPVPGPRAGVAASQSADHLWGQIVSGIQELCRLERLSGWHLLFPDAALKAGLAGMTKRHGLVERGDVRFHWFNRDYQDFEEFLGALRSSKRKTVRRERRQVSAQGVNLCRKVGADITDADWDGFFRCYRDTYRKRSGHDGYLNQLFFKQLRESMAEQLMLVVAQRDAELVGSALFLFDDRKLYGRYWGTIEDVRFLHFEACLYQGIEFCIEHGLSEFDPGTQGEHKLVRGFEPIEISSFHWIADERFRSAISDFVRVEQRGVTAYGENAGNFLPYRRDS